MIRFFTLHPTAANLLMLSLVAIGLVALPGIKKETFPEIKRYEMQVVVPYPGATPLDVEQALCRPLEDALDGISFMEEKRCESRNSKAIMVAKMQESGDFRTFKDDINSAVNGIDSFAAESETPVISELGRTEKVITVALTADLPQTDLKTLAEQLKQQMLQQHIAPLVEITGFSTRQFRIQIKQHKLREYGLSLQSIADAVGRQNLDLPLGEVKTTDRDYQIRLSNESRSVKELEKLTILKGNSGNEVRLGDIATIVDTFENAENKVTFNGKSAAFIEIKKNTRDDSLKILHKVKQFILQDQAKLPAGITLQLTQDYTSILSDRISMLSTNAWQGLGLVFLVMWLFFGLRYSFWVSMGLPISFLASAFILAHIGVSINMISMVALLLGLGLLMDDAIVISESIASQMRQGKNPSQAAIDGTRLVAKGVISSFLTTLCVFTGLAFLQGNIGQVLKVIPIVLISVLTVSLVEAFLILPHHLEHSLSHAARSPESSFRRNFNRGFDQTRMKLDRIVALLIRFRYPFVGGIIAAFIATVSLLPAGFIKFSPFPNVEGDVLQARILMPAGTPLQSTSNVVNRVIDALHRAASPLSDKNVPLVRAVTVTYSQNADAFETGPHLATISVDLLSGEQRNTSLNALIRAWRKAIGPIPGAQNILIKEPQIGPAGRAIEIRLKGNNLDKLSLASHELQRWLNGYAGVSNVMDDLRPGKPEFTLHLKDGAFALGLDARTLANQIRIGYQGYKVMETHVGLNTFDVTVMLDEQSRQRLADFTNFPIIHPKTGEVIPLASVAEIIPTRSYSRIQRIDNFRTVTVFGDVDAEINNTSAILKDLKQGFLADFLQHYPDIELQFQGESKNGGETQSSMAAAFVLGLLGIFILLSFQFSSYLEPVVVMLNIPLALFGVIWGHVLMGLDITLPSMLGFVSLAGIVVNDSILLVEFVKLRVKEGMSVHDAAARASHDRSRAVLLTSLTTMAGMLPLLFETSLQAQILIPLATSIVFGIASSTLLVLFVVPCLYCILEDMGWTTSSQARRSH